MCVESGAPPSRSSQLAGTMRTPRRRSLHRHCAVWTILLRLLRLDAAPGDAPGDEANDQEVDRCCQKIADAKLDRPDVPRRLLPFSSRCNEEYERHDEVVDNGFYKRVKRSRDNDGDGKRNDVLLQQKFPEFLQHAH